MDDQPRKALTAARHRRRWTLNEAASYLGCNYNTLYRWEHGHANPRGDNITALCDVYGMTPEELGLDADCWVPTEPPRVRQGNRLGILVESDLTLRLLGLVITSHPQLQSAIAQAVEEHKRMHGHDPASRLTRREALNRLMALPYALFAIGSVAPKSVGMFLVQCTAGIAAAWELSKSTEHEDLLTAFEGVSDYLPALQQVIKDSSQHRKQAAGLAAQGWQIKTILAFHLEDPARATGYARQGVACAAQCGDRALHAIALRQFSDSLYYENRRELSLEAAQEAISLIEAKPERKPGRRLPPPIPAHAASWAYSGLAACHAQHGRDQEALNALGMAHEALRTNPNAQDADPQDTIAELLLWGGITHYCRGQYNEALGFFEQGIDVNNENYTVKMPMAKRIHVEFINYANLSLLKSSQRDKKTVVKLWAAGMQGARALHSRQRFNEALQAYGIMEALWPNDSQVKDLRELTRW